MCDFSTTISADRKTNARFFTVLYHNEPFERDFCVLYGLRAKRFWPQQLEYLYYLVIYDLEFQL